MLQVFISCVPSKKEIKSLVKNYTYIHQKKSDSSSKQNFITKKDYRRLCESLTKGIGFSIVKQVVTSMLVALLSSLLLNRYLLSKFDTPDLIKVLITVIGTVVVSVAWNRV